MKAKKRALDKQNSNNNNQSSNEYDYPRKFICPVMAKMVLKSSLKQKRAEFPTTLEHNQQKYKNGLIYRVNGIGPKSYIQSFNFVVRELSRGFRRVLGGDLLEDNQVDILLSRLFASSMAFFNSEMDQMFYLVIYNQPISTGKIIKAITDLINKSLEWYATTEKFSRTVDGRKKLKKKTPDEEFSFLTVALVGTLLLGLCNNNVRPETFRSVLEGLEASARINIEKHFRKLYK